MCKGMVFYRTLNITKSAEHAPRPFLASAYRIRRFVREHALANRPHTSLWLLKTYVMEIWGGTQIKSKNDMRDITLLHSKNWISSVSH